MSRLDPRSDRGAAAVEFALVLPVLVVLMLGIVEFGLVLSTQIQLTSAAREGAREMVVSDDVEAARAAAIDAAVGVAPAPTAADIAITPETCATGGTVEVTISYDKPLLTGLFGVEIPLTGQAARACGG